MHTLHNILTYYLLAINLITFYCVWRRQIQSKESQMAHPRSHTTLNGSHRWQHRCMVRHESLASQNIAQKI